MDILDIPRFVSSSQTYNSVSIVFRDDISNNHKVITGYKVAYSTSHDQIMSDDVTGCDVNDYSSGEPITGLKENTTYFFCLKTLGDGVSSRDSSWGEIYTIKTDRGPTDYIFFCKKEDTYDGNAWIYDVWICSSGEGVTASLIDDTSNYGQIKFEYDQAYAPFSFFYATKEYSTVALGEQFGYYDYNSDNPDWKLALPSGYSEWPIDLGNPLSWFSEGKTATINTTEGTYVFCKWINRRLVAVAVFKVGTKAYYLGAGITINYSHWLSNASNGTIHAADEPYNRRIRIDVTSDTDYAGIAFSLQNYDNDFVIQNQYASRFTREKVIEFGSTSFQYAKNMLDSTGYYRIVEKDSDQYYAGIAGTGTYYFYYGADPTGVFASGNTIRFYLTSYGGEEDIIDDEYGMPTGYQVTYNHLDKAAVVMGSNRSSWTDPTDLLSGDYWYRAILSDGDTSVESNSDMVAIVAGDTTEPTALTWTDTSTLSAGDYYYRSVVNNNVSNIESNSDGVTIASVPDDPDEPDPPTPTVLENPQILTWTDTSTLSAGDYYYRAVVNNSGTDIESNSDGVTIASIPDDPDEPDPPTPTVLENPQILTWTDTSTLSAGDYYYRAVVNNSGTDIESNSDGVTIASVPDDPDEPDPPTPTVLENPQTVTWTDTTTLSAGDYYYRAVVNNNGAEIVSNSDSITTGQTVSWTDTGSKTPGNYYYRAIVTSGGTETTTNSDGVTIVTETINLSDTTFEIEAHATSSKLITCSLAPAFGTANGISVQWQYTTTDPASGTPTWSSYGTSQTSSQTISGLTANQKYWFRAILTQGEETQTTNADDNWLTQIINNAGFVLSEFPVIIKRGECAICKGRITNGNGNAIAPGDITAIHYTISKRPTALFETENTIINGHNNISVEVFPTVLKNPVVDDYYIWDTDDIGYNFLHSPNQGFTDPFPEPGFYALTYEILMNNGRKVTPVFNINMLN